MTFSAASAIPARWLLGCVVVLAAACQPKAGRVEVAEHRLLATSFEGLEGWGPTPQPPLSIEKAHTGRYSVRVDNDHPYSITLHTDLGPLSTPRPRRFTFSAWVWVPSVRDDATLTLAIDNPSADPKTVFAKNIFVNDTGPYNCWKKVSRSFDLTGDFHADSKLVLYLNHSQAVDPVFSDDWEVTELR